MAKGEILYGPLKPGSSTRFDIANDPRQGYPVLAASGMVSSTPPWRLGNSGSAWRYAYNQQVGGTRNMISNGSVLYALCHDRGIFTGAGRLILGGGTFYDCSVNATYVTFATFTKKVTADFIPVVQGEFIAAATDLTRYGASNEPFNKAGGSSIGVVNGSTQIKGNATTFTTDTLVGGYGYTPNEALNQIVPGDIIGIGAVNNRNWYRITGINAAAGVNCMGIFPAYQQANADPIDYIVLRTGRGSYSRIVAIPNTATGRTYFYYAGNDGNFLAELGRIEAIDDNAPKVHYMAPQTVNAAGGFVGQPVASDIAYYRGFLLYGNGSSISWSVAGFPTAFPFGATDFPAANITVVDNTDIFVSFEFLGDQLVALFRRGIWLVQITGTIPEFNFYRMAEPVGALHAAATDDQISAVVSYGRPSCTGRSAVYYISRQGLMELSGSTARAVSDPIVDVDFIRGGAGGELYVLTWEPTTNSILWRKAQGYGGLALLYQPDIEAWSYIEWTHPSGLITGLTAGPSFRAATGENFRGFSVAYYVSAASSINFDDADFDTLPQPFGPTAQTGWIWASPVVNLSDVYPFFSFGGFRIDARGPNSVLSTLNWTVYGGRSPQTMVVRDSGTFDYRFGTASARDLLSGKLDDAFVGVVLSGTQWIELTGIVIYDSSHQSRR